MIRIHSYKPGSRSARLLADKLGGKVLRHDKSRYRPRLGDWVVNWGSSRLPAFAPATTLNADVSVASCKLASFRALDHAQVNIPDYRSDIEAAAEMGFPVVCRQKLTGHSGEGIVIANAAEELVDAPLYTKYVKKKDEYRVHVIRIADTEDGDKNYSCVFIQRKARKLDCENPNWQVRNLAGGFSFVEVEKDAIPVDVVRQSYAAVEALGLDFGGVDVIWNDKEQKAYVLECNTACGLEDRTADRYAAAFRDTFEDGGR